MGPFAGAPDILGYGQRPGGFPGLMQSLARLGFPGGAGLGTPMAALGPGATMGPAFSPFGKGGMPGMGAMGGMAGMGGMNPAQAQWAAALVASGLAAQPETQQIQNALAGWQGQGAAGFGLGGTQPR
jgi:hypothetical protein